MILAAIITPTPDFFNLMLFAVPMCLLFFVGVFASYLLVLKREGKKFPWGKVLLDHAAGHSGAGGRIAYCCAAEVALPPGRPLAVLREVVAKTFH